MNTLTINYLSKPPQPRFTNRVPQQGQTWRERLLTPRALRMPEKNQLSPAWELQPEIPADIIWLKWNRVGFSQTRKAKPFGRFATLGLEGWKIWSKDWSIEVSWLRLVLSWNSIKTCSSQSKKKWIKETLKLENWETSKKTWLSLYLQTRLWI